MEAVLAEEHSQEEEGSHGLSLHIPTFVRAYDPFRRKNPVSNAAEESERFSYRKLSFAINSKWEKFLRTKFKEVS